MVITSLRALGQKGIKMIDLIGFYEELDNDKESLGMILEAYIEEYSGFESKILEYYQSNDWSELHLATHSLKGILSNFGESEITVKLEDIERATSNKTAPDEDSILNVVNNLPSIEAHIREAIAALT